MKKIIITITAIIFIIISLFLILPKNSFSENENRYLQEVPAFSVDSLLEGEYIEDLENYMTDHFPLRDIFLTINSNILLFFNQKEINDVYIGDDNYLFLQDKGQGKTDDLINVLNKFDLLYNGQIQLMLVPSSGLINQDKLPEYITYQEQDNRMNLIYESVTIDTIDIRDSLIEGNKTHQMYYKLDHHYTTYGAYYSYLEYCKYNGIEASPLTLDKISSNFKGTLYSKTNLYHYPSDDIYYYPLTKEVTVNYNNEEINTLYFKEHLDTKDQYSYFLDGNHPLMTIETDNANKEEILIIKDSYANSFVPFLTEHYSKIHLIDLRFYNLDVTEYLKENNISNVLILYGINDLDDDPGIYKLK